MFSFSSGMRAGSFLVSYPLPWEMERAKIDVLGIRKVRSVKCISREPNKSLLTNARAPPLRPPAQQPERVGDDLPEGLTEVDENQGLVYV
jgi:hypothetical protein